MIHFSWLQPLVFSFLFNHNYYSKVGTKYQISNAQIAEKHARYKAQEDEKRKNIKPFFTLNQLLEYDGKQRQEIYVAICGRVYDVSSAPEFYGAGGSYETFAGRDISRAAAKFSTELQYLEDPHTEHLSMGEKESLNDYLWRFDSKYEIVGTTEYPRVSKFKLNNGKISLSSSSSSEMFSTLDTKTDANVSNNSTILKLVENNHDDDEIEDDDDYILVKNTDVGSGLTNRIHANDIDDDAKADSIERIDVNKRPTRNTLVIPPKKKS
jgi:membrane-associated progesterone receptor component